MKRLVIIAALVVGGCDSPRSTGLGENKTIAQVESGQEIFERVFTDSTGLGNAQGRFNAPSCVECHNGDDDAPILGGAGDENERHQQPANCLDPATVLHELPQPELAERPTGLRSSNDLFGLGHLDRLSDDEIKAYVASEPRFLGYLGGRYWYNSPMLNINRAGVLGRFGRRAQVATLDQFVRGALINEMGIEGDELGESAIVELVEFVRNAPRLKVQPHQADPPFGFKHFTVPPGRSKSDSTSIPPSQPSDSTGSISLGRQLFVTIGCAVCHNPATEYTDLALHDLGGQDICEGNGNTAFSNFTGGSGDFRTEPLTGLGLQTRFMHDGSAKTLLEALGQHGNEAGFSHLQFNHLADRDNALRSTGQASILAFLRSL